ncbi:MAG: tetratricopeptide repeat protein [Vicinamibacterales bacterium]
MRTHLIRGALAIVVALGLAAPAAAQSTGMVKGKVVDAQGEPIDGARILIEFAEGVTRKNETKTNRRGEYIQIGLFPGNYKVTASKEGVGTQTFEVRVRIGNASEVNFQLSPQAGMSEEDKKKMAALQATLTEGEEAFKAGKSDDAIARFNEALVAMPTCHACYYYIGSAHAQKQQYAEAETAFKKALEMKADFAEAWSGLAGIYNSQKRFDDAAAANAKAAELAGAAGGGGSASAVYNQGVVLWNAQKFVEAKAQFEKAVGLDPNMAEAWYQLGMANLNTGDMNGAVAAFEGYLKAAPDGPKAAEAKSIIAQLKK